MADHELLQLDLDAILRKRIGTKKAWRLPRLATRLLEKIIHQDELNAMLRMGYPRRGSAFCRSVLNYLNNTVEVEGLDRLDRNKRYLFASNHPLGGLDGITLIMVLGEYFGDENIAFLVNDMLMNVEPLSDVFLPINKYGSQGREAAREINATYASGKQMLVFPAGLVSRLHDDGKIRDLEWQKAFVAKAMEYDRDIVLVKFDGLNRRRFYRLARWRKKLGIKVNIEQATLPAEVCASRDKHYRIRFYDPIPAATLRSSGLTPRQLAARLRSRLYE